MEAQEIAVRLGVAVLFSGLIGFERQWRQRMAGLRTNSLVAVGFVVFSMMVSGDDSPTRVAAQVVSGVGFLGAGVILREGSISQASTRPRRFGARRWSEPSRAPDSSPPAGLPPGSSS
jgi:uncharacterized membrane protein YhiD involved in acid resistance